MNVSLELGLASLFEADICFPKLLQVETKGQWNAFQSILSMVPQKSFMLHSS